MGRTIRSLSFDAKKETKAKSKNKFKASSSAERDFYSALRKVAKASGHIVESHTDGAKILNEEGMVRALKNYSEMLTPWAQRQSLKLLQRVNKSNERAYSRESKLIGKSLKLGVGEANVGKVGMALLNEQVELIKSLPLEAGLRAQKIAADNFFHGTRAVPDQSVIDRLTKEMGMTTEVAVNRAKLIARTETARANSSFVQARAAAIGAKGYIWRTTMDGAERESHAEMNGEYVDYEHPPILSDGTTGHAGTFPNCRCYQDPVLPELE